LENFPILHFFAETHAQRRKNTGGINDKGGPLPRGTRARPGPQAAIKAQRGDVEASPAANRSPRAMHPESPAEERRRARLVKRAPGAGLAPERQSSSETSEPSLEKWLESPIATEIR